jgi:hypothetical protein
MGVYHLVLSLLVLVVSCLRAMSESMRRAPYHQARLLVRHTCSILVALRLWYRIASPLGRQHHRARTRASFLKLQTQGASFPLLLQLAGLGSILGLATPTPLCTEGRGPHSFPEQGWAELGSCFSVRPVSGTEPLIVDGLVTYVPK